MRDRRVPTVLALHECQLCGVAFRPIQNKVRIFFCSRDCKDQAKNRERQEVINAAKPHRRCFTCLAELPRTMRSDARYCSDRCNSEAHRFGRILAKRAKKNSSLFSRNDVGERDGWICGICHHSVDRELNHPHEHSASIDHIVALAEGGADDLENLQITHLICNLLKRPNRNP